MLLNILQGMGLASMTKNELAQKVNSAEFEKHYHKLSTYCPKTHEATSNFSPRPAEPPFL